MEAALNALKQEGEAEAALAATRVLEAAVLDQAESVKPPDVPVAVSRTQEYVDTHFHSNTKMEGHRAKDCKADIHCLECNSDAHISAMHAGPPPWTSGSSDSTPEAHGGEPDIPSSTVTTSNCTEEGLKNVFDEAILAALEPPDTKPKKHCILL